MKYDVLEMRALLEAGTVDEQEYLEMLRCSQRDFGRLIDRTGAFVNLLNKLGVASCNFRGNVEVLATFISYWRGYLSPWEQSALIASAVADVENFARVKTTTPLMAPRELGAAIREAELTRLKCELLLRQIDGLPLELMAALDTACRRVDNLRRRQRQAQRQLQSMFEAASLPLPVMATMRLRYIACKKFVAIAEELGKSPRQIYRYHRQGLMSLQC